MVLEGKRKANHDQVPSVTSLLGKATIKNLNISMLAKTQEKVNCHISLVVMLTYTALWKVTWSFLRTLKIELPQSSYPTSYYIRKGNQTSLKKRCLVNCHVYHNTIQKTVMKPTKVFAESGIITPTPPVSGLPELTTSLLASQMREMQCASPLTSLLLLNLIIWDSAPGFIYSEHTPLLNEELARTLSCCSGYQLTLLFLLYRTLQFVLSW